MFKITFFLLSFFTFNVFIFAQDAKSQTDKSRINAPAGMKIMPQKESAYKRILHTGVEAPPTPKSQHGVPSPLPPSNDPSLGLVRVAPPPSKPSSMPATTPPKQQTHKEKILDAINQRLNHLQKLPYPNEEDINEIIKLKKYLIEIGKTSK